jgi:hypothetical protein
MAAAAIAAIYPPLIWISAFVYSEAVFWPIAIAWRWCSTERSPTRSTCEERHSIGIVTGLAFWWRAATGPFVPLAGLWLLWKRQFAAAPALRSDWRSC